MTNAATINADMLSFWNGQGGDIWVARQAHTDTTLAPVTEALVNFAVPRPGETLLDVGCGCGAPTLEFARAVGPSGQVVAMDISGPMLTEAAARARAAGIVNVDWRQEDPAKAKLDEFGLLTSAFGVMFFGDMVGAFANMRRAARPGARMALVCWRGLAVPARFTADGSTIVYSAYWDGKPPEIFTQRLDGSEPVSLGLPPAKLLSVSSQGELAVFLSSPDEHGLEGTGTLARAPLSGGAVRLVLDGVTSADWSPDGRDLAVVRWKDGQDQLEYPIGNVILRPTTAWGVRVSPRGDRVAYCMRRGSSSSTAPAAEPRRT